ncbi:MAG TPA: CehA/McbA family metallohydrolase [Chthoniobacterales bacterium]|nr:CehA/McbA family metallohydrolase [Chthoniobacterales bacterium]
MGRIRPLGSILLAGLLLLSASSLPAERKPVLSQIHLPHSYYYREMYLPQLTTGPSALTFSPDGKELVYSMAGSLWRQTIGSDQAHELTHSAGYDYQPDWSHDGRHIIFTRYLNDALELWQLDLHTGKEVALTSHGDVNVEPRYSPDDRHIAFVSTAGTGHFNLYVAELDGDRLIGSRRLLPEHISTVYRYYYAPTDHSINPCWTPDGQRLLLVSNREVAYGTGDIWSVAVNAPEDAKKILSQETTWRAQPQVAPDGRRVLFSSYHGRQWQQLWLTTVEGAAPLPLTFGEFDRTQARFSPDGSRVGYISNEEGNTSLWVQEIVGGARTRVNANHRQYLHEVGRLQLTVRDEHGNSVPARVSVIAADGRAYAPDNAWMHADDGFDRDVQPFENHYFHCPGECTLTLSTGDARLQVFHGMDYRIAEQNVTIRTGENNTTIRLEPLRLPTQYGHFASADLHVHMNYGGHYRNDPDHLIEQARAEHLDAVYNLIVNKEERVPDIAQFTPRPLRKEGVLLMQGQEFHSSYWGHLDLLDLDDHFLTPDFSAYRESAFSSPYPHNGVVARLTHAQHGLVGCAHPFDEPVNPEKDLHLTNTFPVEIALGGADYYEVVGFSDHRATADIWYRLLNLGFRVPAGAGTDAMANYASLRGPVGVNRVFIAISGEPTPEKLHSGLKQGRTFATNGPLLGLEINSRHPGDEITLDKPTTVPYHAALRSIVPIDHFELVFNGKVVATPRLEGARTQTDVSANVEIPGSGWLVLRAWNDQADPKIQDIYPYASTSPIYVTVNRQPPRSPEDATYFVAWVDRVIANASARSDYNSEQEKRDTLDYLNTARTAFSTRTETARSPVSR